MCRVLIDSIRWCWESFLTNPELKRHRLKVHNPGRMSYECSVCKKIFKSKYNLRDHQLIHTGKKTHICTSCNKSFLTKQYLKEHIQRHENNKQYKCSNCLKNFASTKNLRFHRLHSRCLKSTKKLHSGRLCWTIIDISSGMPYVYKLVFCITADKLCLTDPE